MVKGVNRQIIEVKNTGSEYFERALLFVKSGTTFEEYDSALEEARKYVESLSGSKKETNVKRPKALIAALFAGLIVALMAIVVLLFLCTKM